MQSIANIIKRSTVLPSLLTLTASAVPPKGDMPHKAIGYRGVSKVGEHMIILSEQFLNTLVSEPTPIEAHAYVKRHKPHIPWYKDRDAQAQHHTHQNSSYHPHPSNAAQ